MKTNWLLRYIRTTNEAITSFLHSRLSSAAPRMPSSPFDAIVEKAMSEKNTEEDWNLICDQLGQSSSGPKDCLQSIMKRVNHENPHISMQALILLDDCVTKCGREFHLEVASEEFVSEVRSLLQRKILDETTNKIRSLIKKWSENEFKTDSALISIPSFCYELENAQNRDNESTFTTDLKKKRLIGAAVGGVVIGGAAVVAAPFVLGAVGFGAAGITAGSIAASWMSVAASASGGGVAAGSAVAVLQSAGAVGLGVAGTTAVASAGGAVGAAVGATVADKKTVRDTVLGWFRKKEHEK